MPRKDSVGSWSFSNVWVERRRAHTLSCATRKPTFPQPSKQKKKRIKVSTMRKNFSTGTVLGMGSQLFHPKAQRDKIMRKHVTLERVLQDRELICAFNRYVEQAHVQESLHFWIDVEVYQNLYWKPMQCLGLYEMMMRKRQQQIKSFANYHNSLLGNIKLKDEAPNTIEDTQHDVPPELTQYERDLLACKRLPELKIHASRTMLAEMIFEEYIKDDALNPVCITPEVKDSIVDKLLRLKMGELKDSDEQILTLFRDAQRAVFWDIERDVFIRFKRSKEFKTIMAARERNGIPMSSVHAPGATTANAFFFFIRRTKLTKWKENIDTCDFSFSRRSSAASSSTINLERLTSGNFREIPKDDAPDANDPFASTTLGPMSGSRPRVRYEVGVKMKTLRAPRRAESERLSRLIASDRQKVGEDIEEITTSSQRSNQSLRG